MKKKMRTVLAAFGLSVLAVSPGVSAATSETTTAEVKILGGNLSVTAPQAAVDFGMLTVDGSVQTANVSLSPMTAEDLRGTGEGWHVTVSATPFTSAGADGLSLPTGSLKLFQPASVAGPVTMPVIAGPSPSAIDGAAYKFLSAASGAGLGRYTVTFPAQALELTVNTGSEVVDSVQSPTVYNSVVTWTIVAGP